MKDGRISEQGTYLELLAQEGEFADFLIEYLVEEGDKNLDPQTENELEDLKAELEKTLGKEKLERQITVAKSARVSRKLYRLFFLRLIAHFFAQIYMNCFVSSQTG